MGRALSRAWPGTGEPSHPGTRGRPPLVTPREEGPTWARAQVGVYPLP